MFTIINIFNNDLSTIFIVINRAIYGNGISSSINGPINPPTGYRALGIVGLSALGHTKAVSSLYDFYIDYTNQYVFLSWEDFIPTTTMGVNVIILFAKTSCITQ